MKIRRVILQQPTTIGTFMPRTLVDEGRDDVVSLRLTSAGIELSFANPAMQDPVIIPLTNVAVIVPYRESPEDLAEALDGPQKPLRKHDRTPTDPDGRKRK